MSRYPQTLLPVYHLIDGSQLDDTLVEESEDTLTLLDKFVEDLETDLDKPKIKSIMRNIYQEACEVSL
jgi:hypothetical protein